MVVDRYLGGEKIYLTPQQSIPTPGTVLFEKYELCRVLGTGRTGTVFLAVHTGLLEYRAVKRLAKGFAGYERFRREALILKELRYPGIPVVYDIEEDDTYYYLIEEYLEGESLYDLVKRHGHLTQATAVRYGLQLACIVSYLHSAGPTPILHLDLQPKNLLLCQDIVKLIDFDHAALVGEEAMKLRYGTVGCAAPEQYLLDEELDERTDLYGIGSVIHYLLTGHYPLTPYVPPPGISREFREILETCLKEDRNLRYESADELRARLENLKIPGKNCLYLSSLMIALAGSSRGAGATHMAVGLSVYLRNHGCVAIYEEKNTSGMGTALGEITKADRDRSGLMSYHNFIWKPDYGPGVRLPDPPYQRNVRVLDYGVDVDRAVNSGADGILLICDGRVWNQKAGERAALKVLESNLPYVIIYNHVAEDTKKRLVIGLERKACFRAPYFAGPFRESRTSSRFYGEVLAQLVRMGLPDCETGKISFRVQGRKWKK